jgi:hypothetical protein
VKDTNLELDDFFLEEEEDLIGLDEDLSEEVDEVEEVEEEPSQESVEAEEGEVEVEEDITSSEEEVVEDTPKEVVNTVERYSSTELSYPCFVLEGAEVFPKHIINGLSKMIESSLTVEDPIKVYVSINGNLSSIGGISSIQVKAFIDLLTREKITAYYEKGYVLNGDLIYTLSN